MITVAIWLAVVAVGLMVGMRTSSAAAQPGGTQMLGTVERFLDNTVHLTDGSSFAVTEQTRVTQLVPATAGDLTAGMYVAISAARAMDDVLDASVVAAFPEAARAAPARANVR